MKLSEFVSMPLKEAIDKMELKDFKLHTDDLGDIQSIELKYIPKENTLKGGKKWH